MVPEHTHQCIAACFHRGRRYAFGELYNATAEELENETVPRHFRVVGKPETKTSEPKKKAAPKKAAKKKKEEKSELFE